MTQDQNWDVHTPEVWASAVASSLSSSNNYDMRPYADVLQERHFFRLSIDESTEIAESWSHIEDSGGCGPSHLFNFYWLPVQRCHALIAGQGAMLHQLVVGS